MNSNALFALYEKLYFHEIEVREKLGGRLQTPMAILVSLTGVLAFLLQNSDKQHSALIGNLFLICLFLGAVLLSFATVFFVRSWYGSTYSFLPSAADTDTYRATLEKTYAQYSDGNLLAEKYLSEYLCTYYIRASTNNTRVNDKRSMNLHRTNGTLILAAVAVSGAFLLFYFGDLDKSKSAKPTEVKVVTPIQITGVLMTDKKQETAQSPAIPAAALPTAPPPPAPPPMREIREGVEIVKPKYERQE